MHRLALLDLDERVWHNPYFRTGILEPAQQKVSENKLWILVKSH